MTEPELLAALEAGRDDREVWEAAVRFLPRHLLMLGEMCLEMHLRASRHGLDFPEALMPVAMMLAGDVWNASAGPATAIVWGKNSQHGGGSAPYPARALLLAALRARKGDA